MGARIQKRPWARLALPVLSVIALNVWPAASVAQQVKPAASANHAAHASQTALVTDMIYACAAEAPGAVRALTQEKGSKNAALQFLADVVRSRARNLSSRPGALWDASMTQQSVDQFNIDRAQGRDVGWDLFYLCLDYRFNALVQGEKLMRAMPVRESLMPRSLATAPPPRPPGAASTATIQESPSPGAHWYLWKTDQGCLYYNPAAWSAAQNAKFRRTWFFSITWEGSSCTPGELINGEGVMVEVQNLLVTTGHPGKGIDRYAGTMVNGLWNGTLTHSDQYGKSSHSYAPTQMEMGCVAEQPSCRPPQPPPPGGL